MSQDAGVTSRSVVPPLGLSLAGSEAFKPSPPERPGTPAAGSPLVAARTLTLAPSAPPASEAETPLAAPRTGAAADTTLTLRCTSISHKVTATAGKRTFQPLVACFAADDAKTTELFTAMVNQTSFSVVTLEVYANAANGQPQILPAFRYVLKGAIVSEYSFSWAATEQIVTVAFSFSGIEQVRIDTGATATASDCRP